MEAQGPLTKLMIGIGVNLNTLEAHYPDLKIATSVLRETGIRVPIGKYAEDLTTNLVEMLQVLMNQGFEGQLWEYINEKMYLKG